MGYVAKIKIQLPTIGLLTNSGPFLSLYDITVYNVMAIVGYPCVLGQCSVLLHYFDSRVSDYLHVKIHLKPFVLPIFHCH